MSLFTIGKVARRAGVGVETVRFYEREGLEGLIADPPRTISAGILSNVVFSGKS